jgi:hypothetical protein
VASIGRGRRRGVEIEAEAVADDTLQPHRRGGLAGQGGREAGREPRCAAVAVQHHLLGHALQADDLVGPGAGRLAHPGQVEQAGPHVAGVEQEMSGPGGPQQPPGDLGRAQRGPPGQVVGGLGEGLEVQDRRAPAPDRHAQLGVELGQPGGQRPVRLGDQLLELGLPRLGREGRVDVVIDQGERADRGLQQAGRGRGRVSHGRSGTEYRSGQA